MTKSTSTSERIQSLDLLRGFAVLGILLMNITSFGNVGSAYMNPQMGAGTEGINGIIYGFNWIFSSGRFMSIFSILFGAGMVLFADRMKAKGLSIYSFQYKRLFWLLLFGLIHAYLIWHGDILVTYAICGAIIYLLRNVRISILWIIFGILFLIPVLLLQSSYHFAPEEVLSDILVSWEQTLADQNNEIALLNGSYVDQLSFRIPEAILLQTSLFFFHMLWHASSMMILGIILYRKNILMARRENGFYFKCLIACFLVGISLAVYSLYSSSSQNWDGTNMFFSLCLPIMLQVCSCHLVILWS